MTRILLFAVPAIAAVAVVVGIRRSWPRWRAILDETVFTPVRSWASPPQQVPLATLQRRWLKKALRHVTVTVSGRGALPGGLVFALSPADIDRLGDVHDLLADDSATMLRRTADKHDWLVPADFSIAVEEDPGIPEGRPEARLRRRRAVVAEVAPGPTRTLVLADPRTRPQRTAAASAGPPDPLVRTELHVPCELISLDGGDAIDLELGRADLTIGRNPDSDVCLHHDIVSGAHATIVCRSGQWIVHDRSSLNGTWVNGERVLEAALLHNDEVSFGADGPRFVFSRLSPDLPPVR